MVAARQPRAADAQLAGHADGHEPLRAVEHVSGGVHHGPPDGDSARRRRLRAPARLVVARRDGRLRRAVGVAPTHLMADGALPLRQRLRQRLLVADDDAAQARGQPQAPLRDGRRPLGPEGRGQVDERHALVFEKLCELFGRRRRRFGEHHRARPAQPRGEELFGRHVERERGELKHAVVLGQRVVRDEGVGGVDERAVLDEDALRPPRRPRRVDEIGEVPGDVHARRVLRALGGDARRLLVEQHDPRREPRQFV